jgi:ParB family chromosome partitioning protein
VPNRTDTAAIARVPVTRLRAHPRNIRSDLGDLRELSESIRHEGVLCPLMAESRGDYLMILAGHRRWAAAQMAGLTKVPVVIVGKQFPEDAICLMLAEDKKHPIDPQDKGRAITALRDEFAMTWNEIADRLGVSIGTARAWANAVPAPAVPASRPDPEPYQPVRTVRAAAPRKPPPPRIKAADVHELLAKWDAGDLNPYELVGQLRDWIGDWEPSARLVA